jgi:hypothetical protein
VGTYSTQEFMDTFGGLPEPGEAYVDLDLVRDTARDNPMLATADGEEQHIAIEEAHAAREAELDAAQFNDPCEQELEQYRADLREEYSRPEYHEDAEW